MRITNSMIAARSKNSLQANLRLVDQLRDDISSGVRIRKMSDDPVSGSQVLRAGSSLRAITQFKRNIESGIGRAGAEEQVLNSLGNVLSRGVELAVQQANATATPETRLLAKAEVDSLLSFVADLGNTRFGDEYLFAGDRSTEAPFQDPIPATGSVSALSVGGAPVNPSGQRSLEVGDNKFVTPNHNGTEVFLDTDAIDALRALSDALGSNDVTGVRSTVGRLTGANDSVQGLVGTLGARVNEMETSRDALQRMEIELQAFRSELRDTMVDQAMADLVGKQTLYQAAMSATSRILGLSLANYI